MDKYLVEPFARWIVHSTGWTPAASKAWARAVVVVVIVVPATLFAYWVANGGSL